MSEMEEMPDNIEARLEANIVEEYQRAFMDYCTVVLINNTVGKSEEAVKMKKGLIDGWVSLTKESEERVLKKALENNNVPKEEIDEVFELKQKYLETTIKKLYLLLGVTDES